MTYYSDCRHCWLAASPSAAAAWVQSPGLAYRQFVFMPKMEVYTRYNKSESDCDKCLNTHKTLKTAPIQISSLLMTVY